MTDDWLHAPDAAPCVLVTVAAAQGSVPREPGAKMRVGAAAFEGTIGGGHLEQRALEIARAMLASNAARHLERFALGPGLGQCCGGVAWLAFERIDPAHLALLAARRTHDTWRLVALDGAPDWALFDADSQLAGEGAVPVFSRDGAARIVDAHARRWLVDPVLAPRPHLMLFGAGHVGAALVRALGALPCRVTWVDARDDQFPDHVPANVTPEATDTPEVLVEHAAAGTTFMVMTHSHALDLRLSHAILSRPGADWFGLIGSTTKRAQFVARLRERGIDGARLDAMVCPVGLPGIAGKAPAVIAASVAAQLLAVWEATHSYQEQPEFM